MEDSTFRMVSGRTSKKAPSSWPGQPYLACSKDLSSGYCKAQFFLKVVQYSHLKRKMCCCEVEGGTCWSWGSWPKFLHFKNGLINLGGLPFKSFNRRWESTDESIFWVLDFWQLCMSMVTYPRRHRSWFQWVEKMPFASHLLPTSELWLSTAVFFILWKFRWHDTVDGKNPTPLRMPQMLVFSRLSKSFGGIPRGAPFFPSTVSSEFFELLFFSLSVFPG